jgi:hypothetical protein
VGSLAFEAAIDRPTPLNLLLLNVFESLASASAPAKPIVFAAIVAVEFGRVEMLALHLHDHPMQQAVAEDGVAGNLARYIGKEGGAAMRRQRMRGGENGGHLRVGEVNRSDWHAGALVRWLDAHDYLARLHPPRVEAVF